MFKRWGVWILFMLMSAPVFAQLQGDYYKWRDGNQETCAPNAPNAHWQQISGPYADGNCAQLLPRPVLKRAPMSSSSSVGK